MKVGFSELAMAAAAVAFAFGLGVCFGAHPGALRINDMQASQKRISVGIAIMGGCVAAFWLFFFIG